MKKIKKVILFIFGMAVLLLVTVMVINLPVFDEELSPEVVAIKGIKAKPFSKADAYPAMLAFNKEGDDLLTSADDIRKLLNKKIADTGLDYFDNDEYDRYVRTDLDDNWQQHLKSCNSRRDKKCLTDLFSESQTKVFTDQRLQVQLQKYQQLLTFDTFSDSTQMDFMAPIIAFGPIMKLKRIYLASNYQQSDPQLYIESIKNDLQFWLMLLKEGHLMITKMVAIASVHDSITATSSAVRDKKLSSEQLNQLQEMWRLQAEKTLSMNQVFDFEFKGGIDIYEKAEQSGEFRYLGLFDFFQINATHNSAYEMTGLTRELASLSPAEFYQEVNSKNFEIKVNQEFKLSLSSFYNPTGKMLLSYSVLPYTDYIARIHDMNGMIHLLKLQIELALNTDRSKAEVIAQSKYVNPYTLEPMKYNEESNSIYFECLDKTSVCELDL